MPVNLYNQGTWQIKVYHKVIRLIYHSGLIPSLSWQYAANIHAYANLHLPVSFILLPSTCESPNAHMHVIPYIPEFLSIFTCLKISFLVH